MVRTWRGTVRGADRDEYLRYVEETGLAGYRGTSGCLDSRLLTRDLDGDLCEVVTVSTWESVDAIRGFAGEDVERAIFYPEDDRFLVDRETVVRHYIVRA